MQACKEYDVLGIVHFESRRLTNTKDDSRLSVMLDCLFSYAARQTSSQQLHLASKRKGNKKGSKKGSSHRQNFEPLTEHFFEIAGRVYDMVLRFAQRQGILVEDLLEMEIKRTETSLARSVRAHIKAGFQEFTIPQDLEKSVEWRNSRVRRLLLRLYPNDRGTPRRSGNQSVHEVPVEETQSAQLQVVPSIPAEDRMVDVEHSAPTEDAMKDVQIPAGTVQRVENPTAQEPVPETPTAQEPVPEIPLLTGPEAVVCETSRLRISGGNKRRFPQSPRRRKKKRVIVSSEEEEETISAPVRRSSRSSRGRPTRSSGRAENIINLIQGLPSEEKQQLFDFIVHMQSDFVEDAPEGTAVASVDGRKMAIEVDTHKGRFDDSVAPVPLGFTKTTSDPNRTSMKLLLTTTPPKFWKQAFTVVEEVNLAAWLTTLFIMDDHRAYVFCKDPSIFQHIHHSLFWQAAYNYLADHPENTMNMVGVGPSSRTGRNAHDKASRWLAAASFLDTAGGAYFSQKRQLLDWGFCVMDSFLDPNLSRFQKDMQSNTEWVDVGLNAACNRYEDLRKFVLDKFPGEEGMFDASLDTF